MPLEWFEPTVPASKWLPGSAENYCYYVPSLRKLLQCAVDYLICGLSVCDEQAWFFFFCVFQRSVHQGLLFLLNILRQTSFKIVFTSAECVFFCIILNQFAHAIHTVVYTVTVRAQNDYVSCVMISCFGPIEGTILELVWRDGLKPSDCVLG